MNYKLPSDTSEDKYLRRIDNYYNNEKSNNVLLDTRNDINAEWEFMKIYN